MSISPKVFECISEALDISNCKELYLDGLKVPSITDELKNKIQKISSLTVLSLNECGLQSLKNFPALPNLVRLEVTGNEFPGSDLSHLTHLTQIRSLTLSSNEITSFEQVEILKKFLNLFQLDLSDCSVSEKDGYRAKVFELLPNLKILDNKDNDGVSVDYEDNHDDFVDDDLNLLLMEQEQPNYIKHLIDSSVEDLKNLENQEFYHDMITKPTKEEIGELLSYEYKPSEFTQHLSKLPVDVRGKLIKQFEQEHFPLQKSSSVIIDLISSENQIAAKLLHVFAR